MDAADAEDDHPMVMFEPLTDTSPSATMDHLNLEAPPFDSQMPLTEGDLPTVFSTAKPKDTKKDVLSFALAVFNLMNAILGSGILGLGESLKNLGVVLFFVLLISTAVLACYTITMLLHLSEAYGEKSYEGLARRAFGFKGRIFTSLMIVLHCVGAICSYVFIIKTELPEIVKAFANYDPEIDGPEPIYMNGDFLMLMIVAMIITPLATLKDIKFLGYSSGFGMACMLLFTGTVIGKKFSVPCPLDQVHHDNATGHGMALSVDDDEEQYCSARAFNLNSRTAYAVPTMVFSFMCHASMLPIYAELRRPTIRRMQKVAATAIGNVLVLYLLSATFGYLTFYNKVKSELLLSYSMYNPNDPIIVISRMMVVVCVTLSVPLLHYPARKTVIITVFPKSYLQFSWIRHVVVMVAILTLSVISVLFVPNIRDIFGLSGATSSASLLIILPSAFFIKLTGRRATDKLQAEYKIKRIIAWVIAVLGVIFCALSVIMIVVDWVS